MKDISQRIDYIRKSHDSAKKESDRATYTIKNWRGRNLNLIKLNLDVDYLMFRIENSRTEIQQMKYLRDNPSISKNIFSDPESSKAQEAQETILNYINSKATTKGFLEDLQFRGQEDSAIITYDGYLVNGNRRTAALKTLGERYIECVVLPEDATPKDIYELEQELQISQDFREDYHWINELRNIRRGIEDKRLGFSETEMAKRLRIDIREIKAKRRMLDLIDAFLIWKNIIGQYDYSKLDDTEQIFIQLEKALRKYKNEERSEELRNAVFTLIEEKPSKGRLYGYIIDLIKNFDQVYEKFNDQVPTQGHPTSETENADLLDILLEDEAEEKPPIFNDSKNAKEIASSLLEKIADVKAENKEKNDIEAVYESVSSSLRELQGLSLDNETAKKDSIKNKLEQIISVATELLEQIKLYN